MPAARISSVAGQGVQHHAGALHPLFGPHRVGPAHLGVDEEIVVAVALHGVVHILRRAGAGVELAGRQHAAHLAAGHFLVGQPDRQRAGDQLVVGRLVLDLLPVFARLKHDAGPHKGHVQQHVDLVEGQPVLDQAAVIVKQDPAVFQERVHHAAVLPAAVLLDQRDGRVKMADGHQRLDAVFMAFLKQTAVEGDAGGVGGVVVAVGQDARPGNGQPVALEAHARHQGDVLFIMVVHVDGLVGGVGVVRIAFQHLQLAAGHLHAVRAKGHHVHAGKPAPVHIVGALALVGGGGAAPQKSVRHSHGIVSFREPCSPAAGRAQGRFPVKAPVRRHVAINSIKCPPPKEKPRPANGKHSFIPPAAGRPFENKRTSRPKILPVFCAVCAVCAAFLFDGRRAAAI